MCGFNYWLIHFCGLYFKKSFYALWLFLPLVWCCFNLYSALGSCHGCNGQLSYTNAEESRTFYVIVTPPTEMSRSKFPFFVQFTRKDKLNEIPVNQVTWQSLHTLLQQPWQWCAPPWTYRQPPRMSYHETAPQHAVAKPGHLRSVGSRKFTSRYSLTTKPLLTQFTWRHHQNNLGCAVLVVYVNVCYSVQCTF